jgi:hypothetical protein
VQTPADRLQGGDDPPFAAREAGFGPNPLPLGGIVTENLGFQMLTFRHELSISCHYAFLFSARALFAYILGLFRFGRNAVFAQRRIWGSSKGN